MSGSHAGMPTDGRALRQARRSLGLKIVLKELVFGLVGIGVTLMVLKGLVDLTVAAGVVVSVALALMLAIGIKQATELRMDRALAEAAAAAEAARESEARLEARLKRSASI